jgi:hypothetical protein
MNLEEKRQYCTTASKYGVFVGITFIKQQKALSASELPSVGPISKNTAWLLCALENKTAMLW